MFSIIICFLHDYYIYIYIFFFFENNYHHHNIKGSKKNKCLNKGKIILIVPFLKYIFKYKNI